MKTTELNTGIKIEAEHLNTVNFVRQFCKRYGRMPTNKEVFISIAKDHLKEDRRYYSKLNKAGL